MKTIIKLCIVMTLGVLVSSCVDDDDFIMPLDSGIEEQADFYSSWIVLDNGGKPSKYETVLSYPQGQDLTVPQLMVSEIILEDVVINQEIIQSTTIGPVTNYTTEFEYRFEFSQFVIPVRFTKEEATWSNYGYQVAFPTVKVKVKTDEPVLTKLPDEMVDGQIYQAYSLVLSITDHYFTSKTEVKLLLKTGISVSIDTTYNEYDYFITV